MRPLSSQQKVAHYTFLYSGHFVAWKFFLTFLIFNFPIFWYQIKAILYDTYYHWKPAYLKRNLHKRVHAEIFVKCVFRVISFPSEACKVSEDEENWLPIVFPPWNWRHPSVQCTWMSTWSHKKDKFPLRGKLPLLKTFHFFHYLNWHWHSWYILMGSQYLAPVLP